MKTTLVCVRLILKIPTLTLLADFPSRPSTIQEDSSPHLPPPPPLPPRRKHGRARNSARRKRKNKKATTKKQQRVEEPTAAGEPTVAFDYVPPKPRDKFAPLHIIRLKTALGEDFESAKGCWQGLKRDHESASPTLDELRRLKIPILGWDGMYVAAFLTSPVAHIALEHLFLSWIETTASSWSLLGDPLTIPRGRTFGISGSGEGLLGGFIEPLRGVLRPWNGRTFSASRNLLERGTPEIVEAIIQRSTWGYLWGAGLRFVKPSRYRLIPKLIPHLSALGISPTRGTTDGQSRSTSPTETFAALCTSPTPSSRIIFPSSTNTTGR